MIQGILKGLAVTTVALVLGTTASAAAPTTAHVVYHDESALATVRHRDGCVLTTMFVFGSDSIARGKDPDGLGDMSGASVYIQRTDTCANETLMDVMGYAQDLSEDAFVVDHQLNTAHLQTTVMVSSWDTGESFPITLDVAWDATGDLTHETYAFHHNADGLMIHGQSTGAHRPAAMTGSIVAGTENLLAGASGSGVIQDSKVSSMYIIR